MILSLLLTVLLAQATPLPTSSPEPAASPFPSASASPSPSASASPSPGATLTVSATSIDLNPAQQRTISVSGASPPLVLTLDKKLVTAVADSSNTSVTITATQATGADALHIVDANGATADVAIRVAFNAGTIVPQAALRVTGSPVDPAWLASQVAAFVARLTQAMPGAQTQIGQIATPIAPLAPGVATQFTVPVRVTSPDGTYFDQDGTTTVNVTNLPSDPFAPQLLFYDDDPEHVSADGVLYRGTVAPNAPARLYYYHDATAQPRRLVVALSNESQSASSVQIIDATAGPNIDVMHVGNTTTRQFLIGKAHGQGVVMDLAQDQPLLLHDLTLAPRQLVAGTIDLRVLSGGPVRVTVLAVSAGVDPRSLLDGPVVPGDGHHRTGVFRIAGYGKDRLDYVAGATTDPTIVIGDREPTPPSVDPNAAGHDYGDYGVSHDIDITMQNSGAEPATAYLYFKPLAGVARASFLVDGNVVELGCVRVPQPYQIALYTLPAGQTVRAYVQTMTDGGSFYPAEIGITATPPQPSAPPITAADGCFPLRGASPTATPPPARQEPLGSPTPLPTLSPSPSPAPETFPAVGP